MYTGALVEFSIQLAHGTSCYQSRVLQREVVWGIPPNRFVSPVFRRTCHTLCTNVEQLIQVNQDSKITRAELEPATSGLTCRCSTKLMLSSPIYWPNFTERLTKLANFLLGSVSLQRSVKSVFYPFKTLLSWCCYLLIGINEKHILNVIF